jgi:hypothetical protein
MAGESKVLHTFFPGLSSSPHRVTSAATGAYNCIGWAAGDSGAWWWPDDDPENDAAYWPRDIPREETIAAFVAAFGTLGYIFCDNETPEAGFDKIALYAGTDDRPTHAAKQQPNGSWSSKLGTREDIEHALAALEGELYGRVVLLLKRPTPAQ